MPDMRFSPPPAMRVPDRSGGLNQVRVRTYNERLVMSLLRHHGSLSRMELGQWSGLSAQTVSVIVRALERDSLILAGAAQRGRVGPPSIPMSLNPNGAFAVGIKVGTKSLDTVLIDFVGEVRQHVEVHYRHPEPALVLEAIASGIPAVAADLPEGCSDRLVGIGVCLPEGIESWPREEWGGEQADWRAIDFEAATRRLIDIPAFIQNDVTAAASAEIVFGAARNLGNFGYFFIGSAVESRVVLDHRIYAGRMAVAAALGTNSTPSLLALEAELEAAGHDATAIWQTPENWPDFEEVEAGWVSATARGLGKAILSVLGFLDIETVIVDGRFPQRVREQLCAELAAVLAEEMKGAGGIAVVPGRTGALAKAVGAASLAFHSRFMVENAGLDVGSQHPPAG